MNIKQFEKKKENAKETGTARSGIDRFFLKWVRFRGYPTLLLAVVSFALYLAAKTYYGQNDKAVQLTFVENPSEMTGYSETPQVKPLKQFLSGEEYETAMRLREGAALLMAASLSSFEEFRIRGKFPATSDQVLSDLQKRGLLPPGIELKHGIFRSTLSEFKFNYRSDPFTLEIFSLPGADIRGPAFLLRIPVPVGATNSITYFRSRAGSNFISPAAFSSAEQLVSGGWSIRHWRGEALPLDDSTLRDLHEQDAWLKSLNQGVR